MAIRPVHVVYGKATPVYYQNPKNIHVTDFIESNILDHDPFYFRTSSVSECIGVISFLYVRMCIGLPP